MIVDRTKQILNENNAFAKKNFGQNFLISKSILEKIVSEANLSKDDYVIEIGPGLGSLTEFLCINSSKVLCYEIDEKMIEILEKTLKEYKNKKIIFGDFLKQDVKKDIEEYFGADAKVKVIANLPYYITSDILERIISINNKKIIKVVAMMQKEVGKKLVKKEDKIESYLKVLIDNYCDVSIVTYVGKNDFEPRPNVDSIVLEFRLNKDLYNLNEEYFEVVKECLKNRRKSIVNTLPYEKEYSLSVLEKINVKPMIRIEELTILELKKILEELKNEN